MHEYIYVIDDEEAKGSTVSNSGCAILDPDAVLDLVLEISSVILGISSGMRNGFETTSSYAFSQHSFSLLPPGSLDLPSQQISHSRFAPF